MKRRTFISLMSVMAAAGVLSLAGCSSNTSASTASSTAASASAAAANKLETIQSNGKLVIALEGAWQPWSFHDESDTLVGYDVEVSRAIAEKLGVALRSEERRARVRRERLGQPVRRSGCRPLRPRLQRRRSHRRARQDLRLHHSLRLHPHRPRRPQG